ncbi:hypothetical protein [Pilimelia terevasa]|uniref:hypothetical protein n=1 Tax=Pilimelia terevasa TaxID=53372 RepID=UPI0016676FF1|nr:hypothetical protein [Pilimelia terevasa]
MRSRATAAGPPPPARDARSTWASSLSGDRVPGAGPSASSALNRPPCARATAAAEAAAEVPGGPCVTACRSVRINPARSGAGPSGPMLVTL